MPPVARTPPPRGAVILVLWGMRDGAGCVHREASAAVLHIQIVRPADRVLLGAVSASVGVHIAHLSGGVVALPSSFVPCRSSAVLSFPVAAAVVARSVVGGKSFAVTVVSSSARLETG